MRDGRMIELERAFVALTENADAWDAVERAVTSYCKARHEEGAKAERVIIELKQVALPILRDDYGRLEKLVTKCISDFYEVDNGA